MAEYMKGVVMTAPGIVKVANDIVKPVCGDYECLVDIKACGLCSSTDTKLIDGHFMDVDVTYPAVLGHESAGIVIEKGKKVRNFEMGDQIISAIAFQPEGGKYSDSWSEMVEYGLAYDVKAMLDDNIPIHLPLEKPLGLKFPKEIDIVDGGVLLTLMEQYTTLLNLGMKKGMDVLIYGDGAVGLSQSLFAKKAFEANSVTCIGLLNDRLEKIKTIGKADYIFNSNEVDVEKMLFGKQFDIAIDAVGLPELLRKGVSHLKPNGIGGLIGTPRPENSNFDLLGLPNHVSIHMLTFPYYEARGLEPVCDMILRGDLNPKDFYSHVMPVEKINQAVEMIRQREAFKIILKM